MIELIRIRGEGVNKNKMELGFDSRGRVVSHDMLTVSTFVIIS